MRKKWLLTLSVIMVLVLALAACGNSDKKSSDDNNGAGSASGDDQAATLNVTATNFKFNKKTYKVPANKEITINFKSKEGYHGFEIEGQDVNIQGKGTKTITLKPGTYMVHCSVPCGSGHENMKAKIVAD
ncbi:cupredoxin-like protein [Scopulibacillus darangshiensis]|uniref:Cupredoxin-like protein n=1 Tax=Scopulibacillus darangshiensis TaxID=442528 RepID=A0A4R2P682_9BACL|nr:cupredoxin domain-containing protein [Scopulibacillus darangshiensis]TCP30227.1 cupredoxin-like protein [Scopulibacillus darangshiensis]